MRKRPLGYPIATTSQRHYQKHWYTKTIVFLRSLSLFEFRSLRSTITPNDHTEWSQQPINTKLSCRSFEHEKRKHCLLEKKERFDQNNCGEWMLDIEYLQSLNGMKLNQLWLGLLIKKAAVQEIERLCVSMNYPNLKTQCLTSRSGNYKQVNKFEDGEWRWVHSS